MRTYFFPAAAGDFRSYMVAIAIIVLLAAIAVAVNAIGRKWILQRHITNFLLVYSVVAFIIYLFRFENILYFDADAWIWGLLLAAIVGALWIIYLSVSYVPRYKEAARQSQLKSKYLPTQKSKK